MKYFEVIHIPDYADYEGEYVPLVQHIKENDYKYAIDYLSQWDYGEYPDMYVDDDLDIGKYTSKFVTDEYVLYWNFSEGFVGLIRKLEE